MAIKSKEISFVKAGSLDQDWKGKYGFGEEIVNFRIDPNGGGWVCDRGIENWWTFPSTFHFVGSTEERILKLSSKVDALFVWEKSSTGQVYHLVEQGGELYYFWGNKGQGNVYPLSGYYLSDMIVLDRNRHIPKIGEPGTQFIPYGNRLLIINGWDAPIWFSGNQDWRSYSFNLPTGMPTATTLQPNYLANFKAETGTAFPNFSESDILGLGTIDGSRNQYQWLMTWITSDGSESPISSAISLDWVIDTSHPGEKRKFGVLLNLPQAPFGAVARRIYRTKNMKTTGVAGAQTSIPYFVRQIDENSSTFIVDVLGDGFLTQEAPGLIDSVRVGNTFKFGASWNNRIWLGGGDATPTKIVYSDAGLPETFGAASYFEIGNTGGGNITALVPYYNNLLVFRRAAIEVIRATTAGFTISTLANNIGTAATNAIVNVPNIGIAFINEDGMWIISGGMDGGSQISILRISENLDRSFKSLNKAALAKSIGAYSSKERELWIHYPTDGDTVPTKGLIFHTDIKGFTQRYNYDGDGSTSTPLYKFSAMSVDVEGNFLFGTVPTWTGSPITLGSSGTFVGPIVVWSGANSWGTSMTCTAFDPDYNSYSTSEILQRPTSVWESTWIDFGDNAAKYRVFSVEVEILSYGDLLLELDYAVDYDLEWISTSPQKMALSERVFTAKEDPVFGPTTPSISKSFFTVGSSKVQDGRIIKLRYDVSTSLVSQFKFRLKTAKIASSDISVANTAFHLIGFNINYDVRDQSPLNQSINMQRGQAK